MGPGNKLPSPEGRQETKSGRELARFADVAMYEAAPNSQAERGEMVTPKVTVVHMTPNPLRVMAAAAQLYSGILVTDPNDVTEEQCRLWLADMTKTVLAAPLEFIDIHLFVEGVTRAFTHQMVRQRTAVYVQESQRFAVKRNAAREVAYPPSIAGLKEDHPMRVIWDRAVAQNSWAYNALVDGGVPAEDARGLLETNITTRIHYKTNLRNLVVEGGKRLCSQAQYEWKQFWREALEAIYRYGPDEDRWQQHLIVSLFKPVCYRTGKCEFMAATDRACRIRERVEAYHQAGVPSSNWSGIDPREALLEGAARLRPEHK